MPETREDKLEALLIAEIHHENELIEKRQSRFYLAVTGIGVVVGYFIDRDPTVIQAWLTIAGIIILFLSFAFSLSIVAAYKSQKRLSQALSELPFKSVYWNREGRSIERFGLASALSVPLLLILLSAFLISAFAFG